MKESMTKSANTIRRNLNIESAADDLDRAVADLREAIDALEIHLSPLLSPERPIDTSEDRAQGPSEVSERILSRVDVIRGRSARIRYLIDRL